MELISNDQMMDRSCRRLSGRELADTIRTGIRQDAQTWLDRGITPKLAVIWVEGDLASESYAQTKLRSAEKLGIAVELHRHPVDVSQSDLIECIVRINRDPDVHGMLLELPLPAHLSTAQVIAELDPHKDVDGLTVSNWVALTTGTDGLYPATPLACLRLLDYYGYSLRGTNVALVGCGRTVGSPLLHLLLRAHATVTVCHAYTKDLGMHLRNAEIALIAVGRAGLITPDMVHPELVIVDVGINPTADGRVVGDVDPAVAHVVAAMTPTPGGIGAVTTVEIFANLMRALSHQQGKEPPQF